MNFHPAGSYVSFNRRRHERIVAFCSGFAIGLAGAFALVALGVFA